MNPTRLFLPRAALLLALAGSVLGVPLAATSMLGGAAQDPPTLINHLRTEMASKNAMRQESSLIDVISLANCTRTCTVTLRLLQDKEIRIENDTESGSIVNLEALTPELLKLYRRGPTDGHRLLALAPLIKVGNEMAIETLGQESPAMDWQSQRVKGMPRSSLVAFYLGRYPELTERAERTNTFSLYDVQRVKSARARAAKKAIIN